MNQLKLDFYWRLNKIAAGLGLPVPGIGCTGTSEEETITTRRGVWIRPTGTRAWRRLKPLRDNL